ncbi:DUF6476 family protein [Gemmobacter denitrificans]|uniref:DUF6476 family protein n=1 Tax=Gemmobacter denitrificans TaxID=3123040 RepID=A0ABU8BZM2_9RHOB
MDDPSEPNVFPPELRWLKRLVTGLTLTLIAGVITIVGLLVTRLPLGKPAAPPLPDSIALPEGATPEAITRGRDWIGVVTTDGRMFVFTPDGRLTQEILIQR